MFDGKAIADYLPTSIVKHAFSASDICSKYRYKLKVLRALDGAGFFNHRLCDEQISESITKLNLYKYLFFRQSLFSREDTLDELVDNYVSEMRNNIFDSIINDNDIGKEFIGWLASELESNSLPINQSSSVVNIVRGGVLLSTPDIFFKYVLSKSNSEYLDKHDLILCVKHACKNVQKLNLHINAAKGKYIHTYYERGTRNPIVPVYGLLLNKTDIPSNALRKCDANYSLVTLNSDVSFDIVADKGVIMPSAYGLDPKTNKPCLTSKGRQATRVNKMLGNKFLLDEFLEWLSKGLHDNTIEVNHDRANVILLDEGVAIKSTNIYKEFSLSEYQLPYDTDPSTGYKSIATRLRARLHKRGLHVEDLLGTKYFKVRNETSDRCITPVLILKYSNLCSDRSKLPDVVGTYYLSS